MPLTLGTKLGQYEIVEPIGAGGMGEVYRARDTKLGRDVAIKVLPEEFARDKERLDRFEREARLLAQLNHTNIATLHGLEEHEGQQFLVMELVEGETLAERIAQGPLPVDEAIPLFIQIAEGLEAAHEKGIIHRDLKPANIKIGTDGKPKILDFGLAKAFGGEQDTIADSSQSPTLTKGTALGAIMGTASYMSPEQARGKPVDKRTDIWAFGCCLFEALTATKAFDGDTVADIIATVVHKEPDWRRIPAVAHMRELLRRTLRKNARERLHDIADARIELEMPAQPVAEEVDAPDSSPAYGQIAMALIAGVIVGWLWWGDASAPGVGPIHLSVEIDPAEALDAELDLTSDRVGTTMVPLSRTAFALSPDGRDLVFAGRDRERQGLFRRSLGEDEATAIPGTENAVNPFFSPNGEWIGFWSEGELKKVQLSGGPTITVTATLRNDPVFGASWSAGNRIIYAEREGELRVVSAEGGESFLLESNSDASASRTYPRLPQILPGDDAILFTRGRALDEFEVVIESLTTGDQRVLVEGAAHPIYTASGHLLYVKEGVVWAAPFDLRTLELTGPAKPVLESVVQSVSGSNYANSGAAQISVSKTGTLAYVPGGVLPPVERRLVWVDRDGNTEMLPIEGGNYWFPRVSPTGDRVAIGIEENQQILIFDLRREVAQILPGVGGHVGSWSPDGRRVVFRVDRRVFSQLADGSEQPVLLPFSENKNRKYPGPWLPDGSALLVAEERPATRYDIVRLDIDPPDSNPTVVLGELFTEFHPALSHDGRWLAYASNESGQFEVYVRAYPSLEGKQKVSRNGGSMPVWSASDDELFYMRQISDERQVAIMAAKAVAAQSLQVSTPIELFRGEFHYGALRSFDVSSDGRFLMVDRGTPRPTYTSIRIVTNWFTELERLVPTN